jgi:hypothetical protein
MNNDGANTPYNLKSCPIVGLIGGLAVHNAHGNFFTACLWMRNGDCFSKKMLFALEFAWIRR